MTSRRAAPLLLCAVTGLCAALAALYSMRWPLVGDASLIHYAVLMLRGGWTPYAELKDINLPGSYFFEACMMQLFGEGAAGLRIYDVLLCAALYPATRLALTGKRVSAILATLLFLLIHLQDGLAQAGQRDLLVAVLLLFACGLLVRFHTSEQAAWLLLFGALIGICTTIKPLYLLAVLLILVPSGTPLLRKITNTALGISLPLVCLGWWLVHTGGMADFLQIQRGIVLLHSELGRKSLGFLFAHVFAPVPVAIVLWAVNCILLRPKFTYPRNLLLTYATLAIVFYIAQGKAYPYHRYPLLTALLPLVFADLEEALLFLTPKSIPAALATTFLCLGTAPYAAWQAHTYTGETPMQDALAAELMAFPQPLSGNVQCLDTFGGCLNTLYNLRAEQATGFLYDCYLFTPHQNAASLRYRDEFWQTFTHRRPKIVILTSQFCFADPGGFAKLNNWPQLRDEMDANYTLHTEWQPSQPQHWWSRPEMPAAFRIYVRR